MRTDVQGKLHFRLTFADVDSVQFFFADYYSWMERAFAELMAACGYSRRMATKDRRGYPVVESGCKYLKRAVCDDKLTVVAQFATMSERSFRIEYTFVHEDNSVAATGFTQHVCVDIDKMKACPVPPLFVSKDEKA
ncbi:MAG: acyl-CoA thioesterase [Sphingobacteriales bacterium]|jgi:acyl-CoA thioester hydrolase